MAFNGKRILLGVTGGIAAYKAAELARRLIGCGARVKVVMTRSAQEFVGPLTFAALTGEKVATAMFGPDSDPLEHVALGQEVDAIVVAPATANFIGKVAGGIGDDLLTTIMLAATRPVLICPAMNAEMWANPVVQGNLARLKGRGLHGDGAGRRVPGLRRRGVGPLAGGGPDCGGRRPPALCSGPGGAAGVGHRRTHP